MRDAVAQELDAARPAVFDDDPRRMRVGADRQVRTPPRLVQIGARRAPTPLAVGRALEGAGAFLLAIVEIVVARQPASTPAVTKASANSQRIGWSTTRSGPPAPGVALGPRSWSSAFLK